METRLPPLPVWQREHYLCLTTLLSRRQPPPFSLSVRHKIRLLLPAVIAALETITPSQSPPLCREALTEWLSLRRLEALYQQAVEYSAPGWVTDSLGIYLIGEENRREAHDFLVDMLGEYCRDFDSIYSRTRPLRGDALPLEVIR